MSAPPTQSIVTLQHHDGRTNIFGDRSAVRVHAIHVPRMNLITLEKIIRSELMLEDFVRNELPANARDIFQPGNLLAQHRPSILSNAR